MPVRPADEAKNPSSRARRGRRWMARVCAECAGAKWIAHHTTLGSYDFLKPARSA